MVEVVHKEINLSLPSRIIHDHLIVLVRHIYVPSEQSKTLRTNICEIFKIFYFSKPYSLTHLLTRSVKRSGKPFTATALLLWQKCLEFCHKKPFTVLNACVYALVSYSFSIDPSLWWPLLLSMAAIKGHTQLSISCINVPQHIIMPDSVITA